MLSLSPLPRAVLVPFLLAWGGTGATPGLDFAALAKQALAERQLSLAEGGSSLREFLARDEFVRVSLGSFDLWFPQKELADPRWSEAFKESAALLVKVNRRWREWCTPSEVENEQVSADWTALEKWVQGWSKGELAHAKGDLLDSFGAKDKVREASQRLVQLTKYDDATAQAVGDRNQIVFGPSRKDFLELCAIAGWLHPKERETLWDARLTNRTCAWQGWLQIIGLENVPQPPDPAKPFEGIAMEERSQTAFAQFVADRGAALLLRKQFWRFGTHFFEEALGTNLVLAIVGKNNLYGGDWKIEYHYSGETTQPYERFVPGGNPSGGVLPARKAGFGFVTGSAVEISRYRKNEGEGFFIPNLREGQKAAAKLVRKDKDIPLRDDARAHFELYSFESHETYAMTAPFLGPCAENKTLPPNEFLDDYEDFFRAYRSGFLHWLEEHGAADAATSRQKFAELITKQANRESSKPFHAVVEEVYGVPLSAENGDSDTLEWRYLAFLGSGR